MTIIEKLLNECRSGEPVRQISALQQLASQHGDETIPTILTLLNSTDPVVRSTAAQTLGHLGATFLSEIGTALMGLLGDPEVIVRSEVVDSLGFLRFGPASRRIALLLQEDPEPLVRAAAAESLGDIGDASEISALVSALEDPDEAVRGYAAASLGQFGPALLPQLEKALKAERSPRVVIELLGAAYRLGSRHSLERLLGLVRTADEGLATPFLNLIGDLIERLPSETLARDAGDLGATLTALAARVQLARPHALLLIDKLHGAVGKDAE